MRKTIKQPVRDARTRLKKRLAVVSLFFTLFGLGLISRLFFLQVLQHDTLQARSEKQHLSTVSIYYGRGTIYDRNHNELATNLEVDSVYVNPPEIPDKKHTARVLAQTLGLDRGHLLKKLTSRKHFVWIKRKCPPEESARLRRHHLPGVGFITEHQRFYPKRELAASVIGFVGLDNQGLAGIEHYHHSLLKGKTVRKVMVKDARGRNIRSPYTFGQNKKSRDVVLTLDEVIQFITEYQLKKQVEKFQAKSGTAIVMDPYSGEIYALATVPQFNPNNYSAYPPQAWKNSVISNAYEPGSIFKPIVAAAAIDAGVVRPNDIFFCENGRFRIGRVQIGEADNHKFGWLSLRNIIAKSSNIGAIKVAERLQQGQFYEYIRKFGFGQKIKIDLPGESAGMLRDPSDWSALSKASISFGHEIAVTPLQMVTALAAIANGGNLVQPRITQAVEKDGRIQTRMPNQIIRRVISEQSSRQMVNILKNVVKNGTGKAAAVEGYDVAGKTGTAQKFDPETRTYSNSAFLASFIGFAPADAPRLVILVMIDEPKNKYWGGVVAAPVFREISKQVLRYLNVPSSEEQVYFLDQA